MKKLFFSAFALLAFGSASLAKTIEIEEFQLEKLSIAEVNCQAVYNSTYVYARNQGKTDSVANAIAFAAYDNCLGCPTIKQEPIKK